MEGTKKLRHNKGSNNNNNNNNNNSSSSRNGSNSKNGSNNMRINPPEPEPAADSSPGEDPAWQQNRRPQRIKRSDNLQQKRMASKKGSAPLPAQDFQDQPQFPERFSQRRGKGKHVPWVSEKDQMDRLGLQVLGGRRGDGGDGMEQIRVEKNPLVAR